MERLTERTHGSIADELVEEMGNPIDCVFVKNEHKTCAEICDEHSDCDNCPLYEVMRKLADYEDAEEQGLLLRLPCKVGSTVYCIENECEDMYIEGSDYLFVAEEKFDYYMIEHWGKEVFLTREEAEKALEDMQKG